MFPRILSFACFAALSATPAVADPEKLYLLLGSHHVDTQPGYQPFVEVNPGVMAFYAQDDFDLVFGAYRNSFGKMSVSVAASKTLFQGRDASLSVFAGAAIYPGNGQNFAIHAGDLVPMIGVTVELGPTFISVLPGDGASHDAVVAYGLKIEF